MDFDGGRPVERAGPGRRGAPVGLVAGCAAVLFASAAAGEAAAQERTPAADDHADRPAARAVRAPGPITIDGRPVEEAWASAPAITSFTQNDPEEGRPVSQPTEVRIVYDDRALYVAAVLEDTVPPSARLARRDSYMRDSDWFFVALDTHHDHRTSYRFQVNPAGVRRDAVLSGGGRGGGDDSWDPVWEMETAVSDSGWSVEMRIPFDQLRFPDAGEHVWGLQLEREIARRQEEAVFAFTPKSEQGGIARYGHLEGLEGIHSGAGLELLPYAVGRAEFVPAEVADGVEFADPYHEGPDYLSSAGLDLKYHLASNLTLDATVNPDFGQVEVDPAVVNLTAFETRFEEKRPFFVEGGEIFEFGEGGGNRFDPGTELLYSRRIGGVPRWSSPDEAVYEDAPEVATILGAAKVTGRTAGGWNVGVLQAVTAEEEARFVDASGTPGTEVSAPRSSYFAGRVERNLRGGRSTVGGLATAVHRSLSGLTLRGRLPGEAYSGGVDFSHEWADRMWSLSGSVAGSRIAGSSDAIARAQRSPARYYGRPDADHLELDRDATSLTGYAAELELSKQAGRHWRGRAGVTATSPGFEVNDIGFQRDADRFEAETSIRYVEEQPGETFREWSLELSPEATWNYGGDFLHGRLSAEAGGELLNYWGGEVRYSRNLAAWDDRLTRGGPLTRSVAGNWVSARFNSDARRAWTLRGNVSYGWDRAGADQRRFDLDLEWRPGQAWELSLGPQLSRERSVAQYLGEVDDPTAVETFGRRYLFAALDQTTVSLETRVNVTFQPDLTLEVYAQPFLASADFTAPGELEAPRTFSFLRSGEDVGTLERDDAELVVDPDGPGPADRFRVADPDFNRRSLRGSAVLRWQWRPGSTLFLVWQHRRSQQVGVADFDPSRDADALFRAPGENVFLLKASFWLSP